MKRDLSQFEKQTYDLAVIGGGIYGACVAWEAAHRGLSVALLEKDDFGSSTSANSLKVIHGGFRYMQNLDFKRVRESVQERRALFRIAPHLVHPLPVIIPTYGHGTRGREMLALALRVNDLISLDRNRLDDPQKHIPQGQVLSREECLRRLPGIPAEGLTGGIVFYDAQVYNSERLVLAYLHSAVEAGAQVANYARVTGFLREKDQVSGVQVEDRLGGDRFEVRARLVVNTAGPWVDWIRSSLGGEESAPEIGLARGINLITRPLFDGYAVGIPGRKGEREAAGAKRSGSYLFITPWRGLSILGTIYAPHQGTPAEFKASESDVQNLLDEFNRACPAAGLRRDQVVFVHAGLLPMRGMRADGAIDLLRHYRILDGREQGAPGLLSVVGVKYTTARAVAEKVIDRAFQIWGRTPVPSRSASTPLFGGHISRFDGFLSETTARQPCGLDAAQVRSLVCSYGSAYPQVLRYYREAEDRPGKPGAGPGPVSSYAPADASARGRGRPLTRQQALLRAQTLYGIAEEMAQKLGDIVLRRTELGSAGRPAEESLRFCAEVMAGELGWSEAAVASEIEEVLEVYRLAGRE